MHDETGDPGSSFTEPFTSVRCRPWPTWLVLQVLPEAFVPAPVAEFILSCGLAWPPLAHLVPCKDYVLLFLVGTCAVIYATMLWLRKLAPESPQSWIDRSDPGL